MDAELRRRIRDEIDKHQRRRLARARAQETDAERFRRHAADADDDEHVAPEHTPWTRPHRTGRYEGL